ncbi:MAG: 30S ribosomal protein S9 [Candidatus Chloroheliales bacterium]|nr:MAG: 30S ribosomal protein S9 [Chloroflexota bacterium]
MTSTTSGQATGSRYFYGTGRRKSAVARVRLIPGAGQFIVNGKTTAEYFGGRQLYQQIINEPMAVTSTAGRFSASIKVAGGGVSGQAGAIRHGLARALLAFDASLRQALKRAGLLTRDPRVKERKHVGLKRARKAPQYTKR